ncbi:hypothetical protein QJS10_CPB17g00627 [Acorus calamus]|uniref:Uncharacterized protein n=1 Tax=Acorus calamus TaxID=4465 RepID=A0AAV9CXP3_ACOCL|nr:hypothetical protein QJS10_CPB17g00627 [Acorus calamus]
MWMSPELRSHRLFSGERARLMVMSPGMMSSIREKTIPLLFITRRSSEDFGRRTNRSSE